MGIGMNVPGALILVLCGLVPHWMHVGTEGNWTLVPGQSLCVFQDFSNFEDEGLKELVLNYIFNLLFEEFIHVHNVFWSNSPLNLPLPRGPFISLLPQLLFSDNFMYAF